MSQAAVLDAAIEFVKAIEPRPGSSAESTFKQTQEVVDALTALREAARAYRDGDDLEAPMELLSKVEWGPSDVLLYRMAGEYRPKFDGARMQAVARQAKKYLAAREIENPLVVVMPGQDLERLTEPHARRLLGLLKRQLGET